ncbi:hypothetical protein SK128_018646 [Halocaridina rubra]|uniref:Uncharacterized protein n=1 Tax=Halocaridina rubra TaxID=373956 RepID=A0AAN8WHU3_HALRR
MLNFTIQKNWIIGVICILCRYRARWICDTSIEMKDNINPATEGGKPASSWCRSQARVDGGGWAAGWASGHKNLAKTKIWPVQITGQKHRPHIKVGKDLDEEEDEEEG